MLDFILRLSGKQFSRIGGLLTDLVSALTMMIAIQEEGFAKVVEALEKLQPAQPPCPQPKGVEVEIMYIIKNDQPAFGYAVSVAGVTDFEGEEITNQAILDKLKVEVSSSDTAVLTVEHGADQKTGTISVGRSGEANIVVKVLDANARELAVGGDVFSVTTGDPETIASVAVAFEGLTPAEPAVRTSKKGR